jgi:hypothetical protein
MDALNEFQNIIDENKDNLPDGIYVQLCDTLKRKFDQLKVREENNASYYNVTFIEPKFVMRTIGEGSYYSQLLRPTKLILKLSDIAVKDIMMELDKSGIADGTDHKYNFAHHLIAECEGSHETVVVDTNSMITKIEKL